ncbi:MAG: hypothetical protein KJ592_00950 [Nanoarchaeota archaeon]|nr:hypothetical protein [Nanoarchaeota archaeon]
MMIGKNKRGIETPMYVIISLILGLIVLTLSLYFIFNEYFNQDELDWQMCRQSIALRASLPEVDLKVLKTDTKDAFPLKCKTEVVSIGKGDPDYVYGKISEAIAEGWYMFGEGKFNFIHRDNYKTQTVCMVFARIHYTDELLKDFEKKKNKVGGASEETIFQIVQKVVEGVGDEESITEDVSTVDGKSVVIGVNFPNGEKWGQQGFLDYYNSAKIKGDSTYNDYLPIYFYGEKGKNGNLLFDESVNLIPESENQDHLLVYPLFKTNGVTQGSIWSWLRKGLNYVPSIFPVASENNIKILEGQKYLLMVNSKNIDKIGCDKFLTIPA